MNSYHRRSPIQFNSLPVETRKRDGWSVVLRYEEEGQGPFVIDLSHISKWDIQSSTLSNVRPMGATIPESPGACSYVGGLLINRMNAVQASAWHLLASSPPIPDSQEYTDMTDAFALLCLIGTQLPSIMEKITNLDLFGASGISPFLIQGPVMDVPCQLVVMGSCDKMYGLIIGFARGYSRSMIDGILNAGMQWNLRPAGETVFQNWTRKLIMGSWIHPSSNEKR